MDRRIYVRLTQAQAQALVQLAATERRHPSDQAAAMLAPHLEDVTAAHRPVTPEPEPAEAAASASA